MTSVPKLVAGWILGIHILNDKSSSLFTRILKNRTSLTELVQCLPSKQTYIGSNPIRWIKRHKREYFNIAQILK